MRARIIEWLGDHAAIFTLWIAAAILLSVAPSYGEKGHAAQGDLLTTVYGIPAIAFTTVGVAAVIAGLIMLVVSQSRSSNRY